MNVLTLFATYGFRKASMGDIAKAADLSRQTIYNQFGSKEAVLDWAVGQMLDKVTGNAIDRLSVGDGAPEQILSDAFQAWIGDHVSLIRGTAHGAEIMDSAVEAAVSSERNFEKEFLTAVAGFMRGRGLFPDEPAAHEAAFVLHMASKGLLIKTETSETFRDDMLRVIHVVLGTNADG